MKTVARSCCAGLPLAALARLGVAVAKSPHETETPPRRHEPRARSGGMKGEGGSGWGVPTALARAKRSVQTSRQALRRVAVHLADLPSQHTRVRALHEDRTGK